MTNKRRDKQIITQWHDRLGLKWMSKDQIEKTTFDIPIVSRINQAFLAIHRETDFELNYSVGPFGEAIAVVGKASVQPDGQVGYLRVQIDSYDDDHLQIEAVPQAVTKAFPSRNLEELEQSMIAAFDSSKLTNFMPKMKERKKCMIKPPDFKTCLSSVNTSSIQDSDTDQDESDSSDTDVRLS